ncbi:15581_t:CDS:2 [Funneliformis geosporum]|nr:15581_t:CDS:2 [Funneliformis geosporum]
MTLKAFDNQELVITLSKIETSDNIEFAKFENDEEIFVLSDNKDSDTDRKMDGNDNESINNIYTQPLTFANEWRKTVIDWIEMIENESQDQDNELASITDTYNIFC